MTRILAGLFCCLCLLCLPLKAAAVDIPIKVEFATQGDQTLALISYDIPPDYHAYSHKAGEAGQPTELEFILEDAGQAPVIYPEGIEEKDIYDPSVTVRVYSGKTSLLAILPGHIGGKLYALSLKMLLCSSRHCLPFQTSLTGSAPEQIPPLGQMPWQSEARALLDQASASRDALLFESGSLPPPVQRGQTPSERIIAPGPLADSPEAPSEARQDFDLELTPRFIDADLEIYSLGRALLLGFIAGLILNAMPCVLPVLTLKISGLLMIGGMEGSRKFRSFRLHNLCFAGGILTLFTFLGLFLGVADLIWGQLYQNQIVLLVMLLLIFLMGLSMLGVFVLPVLDLRLGEHTKNPYFKSYLTGLVTTFLATPCSGPLLGGVLAWAFSQPLQTLVTVFWSVGLGMAFPYIVFSVWPGLCRILPKPGNWMLVFERILGFLLLATALYLVYILPEEKRMSILILLLVTAFCAWFWGAFCSLSSPPLRRRLLGPLLLLLICAASAWALRPEAPLPTWQTFSPQQFARDLGHRDMLVEFTADWCPNCKFLEASVLTEKNLRAWQKKYGLELIRVDLTKPNAYGETLLAQLGSKSIPLTALFGHGNEARSPLVLRDLYGKATLESALKQAF